MDEGNSDQNRDRKGKGKMYTEDLIILSEEESPEKKDSQGINRNLVHGGGSSSSVQEIQTTPMVILDDPDDPNAARIDDTNVPMPGQIVRYAGSSSSSVQENVNVPLVILDSMEEEDDDVFTQLALLEELTPSFSFEGLMQDLIPFHETVSSYDVLSRGESSKTKDDDQGNQIVTYAGSSSSSVQETGPTGLPDYSGNLNVFPPALPQTPSFRPRRRSNQDRMSRRTQPRPQSRPPTDFYLPPVSLEALMPAEDLNRLHTNFPMPAPPQTAPEYGVFRPGSSSSVPATLPDSFVRNFSTALTVSENYPIPPPRRSGLPPLPPRRRSTQDRRRNTQPVPKPPSRPFTNFPLWPPVQVGEGSSSSSTSPFHYFNLSSSDYPTSSKAWLHNQCRFCQQPHPDFWAMVLHEFNHLVQCEMYHRERGIHTYDNISRRYMLEMLPRLMPLPPDFDYRQIVPMAFDNNNSSNINIPPMIPISFESYQNIVRLVHGGEGSSRRGGVRFHDNSGGDERASQRPRTMSSVSVSQTRIIEIDDDDDGTVDLQLRVGTSASVENRERDGGGGDHDMNVEEKDGVDLLSRLGKEPSE